MTVQLNDNSFLDLNPFYVPSNIFNFERNSRLEKNEGSTSFVHFGDKHVKPFFIELSYIRKYNSPQELRQDIAFQSQIIETSKRIYYENIFFDVQRGWIDWQYGSNYREVTATAKLIPFFTDYSMAV